MDILGLAHRGADFSWPVFDPAGTLLAPGHAHAREGWTRCGKPWPHVIDPSNLRAATGYRPDERFVAAYLRPPEKREAFLCAQCLETVREGEMP
jgi:hypothetical protein